MSHRPAGGHMGPPLRNGKEPYRQAGGADSPYREWPGQAQPSAGVSRPQTRNHQDMNFGLAPPVQNSPLAKFPPTISQKSRRKFRAALLDLTTLPSGRSISSSSRRAPSAWPGSSGPPPLRGRPGPRTAPRRRPGRWASPPPPSAPACGHWRQRSSPPPPRRSP